MLGDLMQAVGVKDNLPAQDVVRHMRAVAREAPAGMDIMAARRYAYDALLRYVGRGLVDARMEIGCGAFVQEYVEHAIRTDLATYYRVLAMRRDGRAIATLEIAFTRLGWEVPSEDGAS